MTCAIPTYDTSIMGTIYCQYHHPHMQMQVKLVYCKNNCVCIFLKLELFYVVASGIADMTRCCCLVTWCTSNVWPDLSLPWGPIAIVLLLQVVTLSLTSKCCVVDTLSWSYLQMASSPRFQAEHLTGCCINTIPSPLNIEPDTHTQKSSMTTPKPTNPMGIPPDW